MKLETQEVLPWIAGSELQVESLFRSTCLQDAINHIKMVCFRSNHEQLKCDHQTSRIQIQETNLSNHMTRAVRRETLETRKWNCTQAMASLAKHDKGGLISSCSDRYVRLGNHYMRLVKTLFKKQKHVPCVFRSSHRNTSKSLENEKYRGNTSR